ncbi:DUF1854 domain-containing protein [Caldimonas tepidiphila]|uniref:cyanophycin metabolism-associated DUF1854 family protein n=1 Tax=Caldimonas tepidiphila TaxID=2315841 RepID=UPI000E5B2ED5|nr:DUF1854 domain-containing protein [Caldimonas tepidiphila]
MLAPDYRLERDAFGRLCLIDAAGERHAGVVPVRAFPLAAPNEGIALMGPDGHELVWIARLDALPPGLRSLIEEELAAREFVPEILKLREVSSFATPSTWSVDTDRGPASFVLKGEEDIRRVADGSLLIADSHGIHFRIRDPRALDAHSRKLLDRFL